MFDLAPLDVARIDWDVSIGVGSMLHKLIEMFLLVLFDVAWVISNVSLLFWWCCNIYFHVSAATFSCCDICISMFHYVLANIAWNNCPVLQQIFVTESCFVQHGLMLRWNVVLLKRIWQVQYQSDSYSTLIWRLRTHPLLAPRSDVRVDLTATAHWSYGCGPIRCYLPDWTSGV
jgi:hypothetical protein